MKLRSVLEAVGTGRRTRTIETVSVLLFSVALAVSAAPPESESGGGDRQPQRAAVESQVRGGLPNFLAKVKKGAAPQDRKIRVAYLGGSITAAPGWRVKSFEWLRARYPKVELEEINAAIGGTGSDLGVFRLNQDVLRHDPDLVFVEFAVNDGGAPRVRIHRAMEGIVRQIWAHDPRTDICFVYTVSEPFLADLQAGKFSKSASAMEEIADFYKIPSIHLGMEAAKLEGEGKLIWKGDPGAATGTDGPMVFSKDGVHPLVETGHELYLQALVRGFEMIEGGAVQNHPHVLHEPMRPDNWMAAKLVPLDDKLLTGDWEKLDPEQDAVAKRFARLMPEMWKASTYNAGIRFRFRGSVVGVYDLVGPDCGQVNVQIDGGETKIVPRFDGYSTYHRLSQLKASSDLSPGEVHEIVLTLDDQSPDKAAILFDRNKADLQANPGKYEGASWYAGSVMLLGERVE